MRRQIIFFIDSYKIEDDPQKSEKTEKKKSSYREPLILIAFVIIGAVLGLALGEKALVHQLYLILVRFLLYLHFKGIVLLNVQLMRQLIVIRMKYMETTDELKLKVKNK